MSELPAHSETLQVLLSVEELDELERVATRRGLSTSAVAREAIRLRVVARDCDTQPTVRPLSVSTRG